MTSKDMLIERLEALIAKVRALDIVDWELHSNAGATRLEPREGDEFARHELTGEYTFVLKVNPKEEQS